MTRLKCFLRELIAGEVKAKLTLIHKEQQRIMAAIDDLRNKVAELGTSVSNELAAISAKLSTPGGTSDEDIEAVVAQLDTLKGQIDAETAALTAPAANAAATT
jgi:hypothetical protein